MYKYKASVVITSTMQPTIRVEDLSELSMIEIYKRYIRAYVVAEDTISSREVIINLDVLKKEYNLSPYTLSKVLASIKTINTVDAIPTKVKVATYRDAFLSNYKVDLCNMMQELPENYPKKDLHDIVITRPLYHTDLTMLHTHCLLTINGLIHPSDASLSKNEAYIPKGADVLRYSNKNQLGILSFADIGEVKKYRIRDDDIMSSGEDVALLDKLYIKTKADLTDKTVFLSLGGYLIKQENGILEQINSNLICLQLHKLHLLEKYFDSKDLIDLSDLGLEQTDRDNDLINVKDLYSDKTIRAWLQLHQSFLIVVDAKDIIYNRIYLRPGKLPGRYISYHEPILPLMTGYGKLVEYWATEDDKQWNISTIPNGYNNYTFKNTTKYYAKNVTDSRLPSYTYDIEHPYFLQLLFLSTT